MFLKSFCNTLLPSEEWTETSDILHNYVEFVKVRMQCTNKGTIDQAKSGFYRAFKKIAANRKWKEKTKPRGYHISLPRISRSFTNEGRTGLGCNSYEFCEKIFIDKK